MATLTFQADSTQTKGNILINGIPSTEIGLDYIKVPTGTTGQRPVTPQPGMIRFNTTTNSMEFWNPVFGVWKEIFGGTVSANGGIVTDLAIAGQIYRVHSYTALGASLFNVTAGVGEVEYLAVAGGGGGGSWVGGGGGAGGVLFGSMLVSSGESYNITVGAGGIGSLNPGNYTGMPNGSKGGNSSIGSSIVAIGGGMGASHTQNNTAIWVDGGSGGGNSGPSHSVQGRGILGQGNDGGIGHNTNPWSTGGGGGAGARGQDRIDGNTSGNGGVGRYFGDIFGTGFGQNGWFGGGGGGGKHDPGGVAGQGGLGGGGNGLVSSTGKAGNGLSNTGGGGGGNGNSGASRSEGGNGGSGIVLIRYRIG